MIYNFFTDPFDVLKTRMMMAGGRETPSITKTATELFSKQGISGFYRGIDSNIARAMVLNGTKMGVYDQSKGYVVALTGLPKKSLLTQFMSAVTAGKSAKVPVNAGCTFKGAHLFSNFLCA